MANERTIRRLASRLCAVADQDRDLSQGAKVLLRKITMISDWSQSRTGLCFPGYARLAELVARSVRMIGNYLRELRERGYLSWSRRQRMANVYFLNFDRVTADPPARPAGLPLAVEGYPFAGGRLNLPGVREPLRGAAARTEPSRVQRSGTLDGVPPVLGRLSASILATFGAGR